MPYANPWGDSFSGAGGATSGGPQYGGQGSAYVNPFLDPEFMKTVPNTDVLGQDNGNPGWGLIKNGYGGGENFQNWLGGQQKDEYQKYEGLASQQPGLQWFDYLKSQDYGTKYNQQSPTQRGIKPGAWSSPLVKFTSR